jgi:hypothetical protein
MAASKPSGYLGEAALVGGQLLLGQAGDIAGLGISIQVKKF